jgi:hypothetical protein
MYETFGCPVTHAVILNFEKVLDSRPNGSVNPRRIFVTGDSFVFIMFAEKVDWDTVVMWFGYVLMNTRGGFRGGPTRVMLVPNEDAIVKSINVRDASILDTTHQIALPINQDPQLTVQSIRNDKFRVTLHPAWNMNVTGTLITCASGVNSRWFDVICCPEFIEQLRTIERAIQTAIPDCESVITRTRESKFAAKPYMDYINEKVILDGVSKSFEEIKSMGRLHVMTTVQVPYAYVKDGAAIVWIVIKHLRTVEV